MRCSSAVVKPQVRRKARVQISQRCSGAIRFLEDASDNKACAGPAYGARPAAISIFVKWDHIPDATSSVNRGFRGATKPWTPIAANVAIWDFPYCHHTSHSTHHCCTHCSDSRLVAVPFGACPIFLQRPTAHSAGIAMCAQPIFIHCRHVQIQSCSVSTDVSVSHPPC